MSTNERDMVLSSFQHDELLCAGEQNVSGETLDLESWYPLHHSCRLGPWLTVLQ